MIVYELLLSSLSWAKLVADMYQCNSGVDIYSTAKMLLQKCPLHCDLANLLVSSGYCASLAGKMEQDILHLAA